MSVYVDTDLFVSAVANEEATARAQAWMAAHLDDGVVSSHWLITEASSALAMKVRAREWSEAQRRASLRAMDTLRAHIEIEPVLGVDFERAARLMDGPGVALRSGDSLHLAVAMRLNLPVRTLDRKFVSGAAETGHDVRHAFGQ